MTCTTEVYPLFRQCIWLTIAVIHIPTGILIVNSFTCNNNFDPHSPFHHLYYHHQYHHHMQRRPPLPKWQYNRWTLMQPLSRQRRIFRCFNSNKDALDDYDDDEKEEESARALDGPNTVEEETLLRISLMISPSIVTGINDINVKNDDYDHALQLQQLQQQDDAIEEITKFCASFPFAAILPVQPLQYFPIQLDNDHDVHDDEDDHDDHSTGQSGQSRHNRRRRCVEVQFLRKKTPERGSIDGGIRFYIQPLPLPLASGNTDDDSDDDDDDDDDVDKNNNNSNNDINMHHLTMIELIAKRNSQGQVITKIFAEKLIITNFVSFFLGTNRNTTTTTTTTTSNQSLLNVSLRYPSPIVQNMVQLQSIYHKWM